MQSRGLEEDSRHLDEVDDRSFLRELGAWLAVAEESRGSRRVLADLRAEYLRALDGYHRFDDAAVARLAELRERLGRLVTAAGGRAPSRHGHPDPCAVEGPGRAHELIGDLRRELQHALSAGGARSNESAALRQLDREVDELAEAHGRRQRELIALLHSSPSGSLRRLDWLAEEVALRSRGPAPVEGAEAGADGALRAALASVRPLLHAALSDQIELTPSEQRQLGHIVAGAREDAARVHERVIRRVHAEERPAARHAGARARASLRRSGGRCT